VLDRLTSVTYSASSPSTQSYVYDDPNFPFALTGVIDENGKRYATWTYDEFGRATSSQNAGGADRTQISYNDSDNSRTETNAFGVQTVYRFREIQGIAKLARMERLPPRRRHRQRVLTSTTSMGISRVRPTGTAIRRLISMIPVV
jgi:YD repeat-containing protein